jgi:hypothetical protein
LDFHLNLLLALYHQAREEVGQYDSGLWQIPTISYALNGIMLGFIINRNFYGRVAIGLSFALFILAVPLTAALVKNRIFQKVRVAYAKDLFNSLVLVGEVDGVSDIPTSSKEAEYWLELEYERDQRNGEKQRWVEHLGERLFRGGSAYGFLLAALLATHLVQIGLLSVVIARTV